MKKIFLILLLVLSVSLYSDDSLIEKYGFSPNESLEFNQNLNKDNSINLENNLEFKLTGEFSVENRKMLEKSSKIESGPELLLGIFSERGNAEINLELEFNEDNAVEDILKEGYLRLYLKNADIEIGKSKIVWGKTDGLHVIDYLNPMDESEVYNKTYLERKIAQEMLKVNFYIGKGILESAYIFAFESNRSAINSVWQAQDSKKMNDYVEKLSGERETLETVQEYLTDKYSEYKNSQIGLRYTNSFGKIDYGVSYYNGYLRDAIVNKSNISKLITIVDLDDLSKIVSDEQKVIYEAQRDYLLADLGITMQELGMSTEEYRETIFEIGGIKFDEINVYGVEFSTDVLKTSLKGEFAYSTTKDKKGDDPNTSNARLESVISVEKLLPFNNLNVLCQLQTKYLLDEDKIKDNFIINPSNGLEYSIDTDCNELLAKDFDSLSNIISIVLSDSFVGEKYNFSIEYFTLLEDKSYYIKPKFIYKLKNQTEIELKYSTYVGKTDSVFKTYEDNDYFEINYKYRF